MKWNDWFVSYYRLHSYNMCTFQIRYSLVKNVIWSVFYCKWGRTLEMFLKIEKVFGLLIPVIALVYYSRLHRHSLEVILARKHYPNQLTWCECPGNCLDSWFLLEFVTVNGIQMESIFESYNLDKQWGPPVEDDIMKIWRMIKLWTWEDYQ